MPNNEPNSAPVSLRHAAVMEALQPLCDLIGVPADEMFADPPLSIGKAVTFAAIPEVGERLSSCVVREIVVGDDPKWQERAVEISIPLDIYLPAEPVV
jgi:hypothetical protein